jgi:hypothetical protein
MRTLVKHPDFIAADLVAGATPPAPAPQRPAKNRATQPETDRVYEPPPEAPRRARRIAASARQTQEYLLMR